MQEQENIEAASEAAGGEPAPRATPTAAPTVPPPPTIPSVSDPETSGIIINEILDLVLHRETHNRRMGYILRRAHKRIKRMERKMKRPKKIRKLTDELRREREARRMVKSQTQAEASTLETEPPSGDDAGTTNNSEPHDCTSTSPTPSTSTSPIASTSTSPIASTSTRPSPSTRPRPRPRPSTSTGRGMHLSPRTGSGVRTKKSRRDFRLAKLESLIRRLCQD